MTTDTTRVWMVKTDDDHDGVIVSFVDDGEVNGIYLYEPGADPVELISVGIDGFATEFEQATVTGDVMTDLMLSNGDRHTESRQWPGDELVSKASRDAAVDQVTEERDEIRAAMGSATQYAQNLRDALLRVHNESESDAGHWGLFQVCQHDLCRVANRDVPVTVEA